MVSSVVIEIILGIENRAAPVPKGFSCEAQWHRWWMEKTILRCHIPCFLEGWASVSNCQVTLVEKCLSHPRQLGYFLLNLSYL